eukprot:CAMPEP_0114656044 /NCGR_PEP_ID=MMETSP0191-20121206/11768_1 /TAXON_ID=126664 /ORGANISM="Sorites sp." /LENGTH=215 /DNA_ID=CAMNT_0001872501 /DNA_START=106 /DNA_END=750 /DNA_ORIENTATION=+
MSRKIVIAEYDYEGQDDNQLTFNEGDKIEVIEEDSGGWWEGRLIKNGNVGYFPVTYIKQNEGDGVTETTGIDLNVEINETNNNSSNENNVDASTPLNTNEEQKGIMVDGSGQTSTVNANGSTKSSDKGKGKKHETNDEPYRNPANVVIQNNNMVNIEKIEYNGPIGAEGENYYSAEILNLKFNPNAKSRFGLAAHYMAYSSSLTMILLSFAAFAW